LSKKKVTSDAEMVGLLKTQTRRRCHRRKLTMPEGSPNMILDPPFLFNLVSSLLKILRLRLSHSRLKRAVSRS